MQQGSLIARLLLHTNQVIPALGQGADGMVAVKPMEAMQIKPAR
jgi:hypothetical protein